MMWNRREVEIPPKIEALLKKRGWTFLPPTEEMKREWREAGERSAGNSHTPPEVWEQLAQEFGDWGMPKRFWRRQVLPADWLRLLTSVPPIWAWPQQNNSLKMASRLFFANDCMHHAKPTGIENRLRCNGF